MSHIDYKLKDEEYIWVNFKEELEKLLNYYRNNNRKPNERRCIIVSTEDALKGVKSKPFRYTVDFTKPLSNEHLERI